MTISSLVHPVPPAYYPRHPSNSPRFVSPNPASPSNMDMVVDASPRRNAYEANSNESNADTAVESMVQVYGSTTQMSDGKISRSIKPSNTGCRQRVTVVCSECKRLKLKCDRRTPCQSCLKRDSVQRCIYTQAASERIDVQTLNIRLSALEDKVCAVEGSGTGAAQFLPLNNRSRNDPENRRAYVVVGQHGASVAINLEGAAGLWVDDLHINLSNAKDPASAALELLPVPPVADAGVVDLLDDYTDLFRVSGPPDINGDVDMDDDDKPGHIGVSPELVRALPNRELRNELYSRLEGAHIIAPAVIFNVFKQRIEDMCTWAEKCTNSLPDENQISPAPTLTFYAATASALAMGALGWLAERDLPMSSNVATEQGSMNDSGRNGADKAALSPDSNASNSGDEDSPFPIDASLPMTLYRLSKLAIWLAKECAGYSAYDIDFMHAVSLQARYLLVSHHGLVDGVEFLSGFNPTRRKRVRKAKAKLKANGVGAGATTNGMVNGTQSSDGAASTKPKNRGPALALSPELAGLVGELVSNARMMGLNHDPDIAGDKLSPYEKEVRRRMWWEVVTLDAFVAECIGEAPLIALDRATTSVPSDVDDDVFTPDCLTLPPPNIEALQGNIEYFIQRCRLLELLRNASRRVEAFKELHRDSSPGETREILEMIKKDIQQWLEGLPDHLKLKDVPSTHFDEVRGTSARKSPVSFDQDTPPVYVADSPFHVAMRCDLAIAARSAYVSLCLPLIKGIAGPTKSTQSDFTSSAASLDVLYIMEPTMFIIRTWKYLHSIFKFVRPSMFMCFAFTKKLFDATVILGHIAIAQPMIAPTAVESIKLAANVLRDPSVLSGRSLMADIDSLPSEAVKIVEELILRAEIGAGIPQSNGVKRKREDVEGAPSDFMYHFRFPYVGAAVVSAGLVPAPAPPDPTAVTMFASPLVDVMAATAPQPAIIRTIDASTNRPRQYEQQQQQQQLQQQQPQQQPQQQRSSPVAKGDLRPTTKQKSAHSNTAVRNRAQKTKDRDRDASRVRGNSIAADRSDAQMLAPPSSQQQQQQQGSQAQQLQYQQQQHRQQRTDQAQAQASYQIPVSGTGSVTDQSGYISSPGTDFSQAGGGYSENGYTSSHQAAAVVAAVAAGFPQPYQQSPQSVNVGVGVDLNSIPVPVPSSLHTQGHGPPSATVGYDPFSGGSGGPEDLSPNASSNSQGGPQDTFAPNGLDYPLVVSQSEYDSRVQEASVNQQGQASYQHHSHHAPEPTGIPGQPHRIDHLQTHDASQSSWSPNNVFWNDLSAYYH